MSNSRIINEGSPLAERCLGRAEATALKCDMRTAYPGAVAEEGLGRGL